MTMMDDQSRDAMINALKTGQVVVMAGGCDDCMANMRLQVKNERTEMTVYHAATCPTDLGKGE